MARRCDDRKYGRCSLTEPDLWIPRDDMFAVSVSFHGFNPDAQELGEGEHSAPLRVEGRVQLRLESSAYQSFLAETQRSAWSAGTMSRRVADGLKHGYCRVKDRWIPRDEMCIVYVSFFGLSFGECQSKIQIRLSLDAYEEMRTRMDGIRWKNELRTQSDLEVAGLIARVDSECA